MFTHGEQRENNEIITSDDIRKAVPLFQRDNDKWTREMQVKFLENLIMGCETQLMLYTLTDDMIECLILDGLQRTTAILDFIDGKIKVFGYDFNTLKENRILRKANIRIKLKIYKFKNEKQAVDFYIAINENITHSKDDIKRAYEYRKTLC